MNGKLGFNFDILPQGEDAPLGWEKPSGNIIV